MAKRSRRSGGGIRGIFSGLFSMKGLIMVAIGGLLVFLVPSIGTFFQGVANKIKPEPKQ